MRPYIGKIRITCDGRRHVGKKSKDTGAGCVNCPGAVIEVLDLDGEVIAKQSAGEPVPVILAGGDSGEELEG